jgi:hypothetical protein
MKQNKYNVILNIKLDERLQEISKDDGRYKPITDLMEK